MNFSPASLRRCIKQTSNHLAQTEQTAIIKTDTNQLPVVSCHKIQVQLLLLDTCPSSNNKTMNALLARNLSKASNGIRCFSSGAIPTSSTAQSGGYKVMGLNHLSVSFFPDIMPRSNLSETHILRVVVNSIALDTCHESRIQEEELAERSLHLPSHRVSFGSCGYVQWIRNLFPLHCS